MAIKRKGFIWTAFTFAIANLVVALTVFSFCLFDILSKTRNIGVPSIQTLRVYLSEMMAITVASVVFSIFTMWAVSTARKKNKVTATLVIILHLVLGIGGLFLTGALCALYREPGLTQAQIFNFTRYDIAEGARDEGNPKYIPPWLDEIQKKDPDCCGIMTFRDWNVLWAPLKDQVPASCCLKKRKDCVTNFKRIIYPDLPSLNIKAEDGCHAQINGKIKQIILEAKKFGVIFTIFMTLSLIVMCVLYLVVFYLKRPLEDEDDEYDVPTVSASVQEPPKFSDEDQNWPNLEFYKVRMSGKKPAKKLRKNKVPVMGNMIGVIGSDGSMVLPQNPGSANIRPVQQSYAQSSSASTNNPDLSQSQAQPQQQVQNQPPPQVQYKIDYLTPDPAPVPADTKVGVPQTQFIPEVQTYNSEDVGGPSAAGQDPTADDPDTEILPRHHHIHVRGYLKKSRRRHH